MHMGEGGWVGWDCSAVAAVAVAAAAVVVAPPLVPVLVLVSVQFTLVCTGLGGLGHPKNPGTVFFGGSEAPQARREGEKSLDFQSRDSENGFPR